MFDPRNLKREYQYSATPTQYAGTVYRSKLEARWALFFDLVGIKFNYEPKHIEFTSSIDGEKTGYLPDFWMPDLNGGSYVEIKPDAPAPNEIEKAVKLCRQTGRPVYIHFSILHLWDHDGNDRVNVLINEHDPAFSPWLFLPSDWFSDQVNIAACCGHVIGPIGGATWYMHDMYWRNAKTGKHQIVPDLLYKAMEREF